METHQLIPTSLRNSAVRSHTCRDQEALPFSSSVISSLAHSPHFMRDYS